MWVGGRAKWVVTALAVATTLIIAAPASARLSLEPAFTGGTVTMPMYVTSPPGDSHRLFIVTRPGVIYVAVDGVLQSTPFLDISSRVWSSQGEAAMGSMAFDPGYEDPNSPGYGLFYVYYVANPKPGEADGSIRVEEFRADPQQSPNVANPAGRVVLTIPHNSSPFHYGGTIQFNPNDGLLYIGTGDGDDAADDYPDAQSTKSLLGKILRIDPHASGNEPYSIPSGNPFHGQPLCNPPSGDTDCPEILASGLRNPFRWSFDRATGDIAIGDVGQDAWEEVDYVPASASLAGDNFGWPCREGPTFTYLNCDVDPRVDPVWSYPHPTPPSGTAITGGVVVRDPGLGELQGRYLYADFFDGIVHSLQLATPTATDDRIEADLPAVKNVVAFNEDADGHVYVVTLSGTVQRLTCADCPAAPQVRVVNTLDPNTDQGRFDLKINGTMWSGPGGAGDGGTTDFHPVAPGSVTVSEAGHKGTSLDNYDAQVSCDSGKGSSNSTSTTFTVADGDQVTCTITNHRKPQVRVVNKLDPNTDGGRFDLSIAGTSYDNGGPGFGDGGDTGFKQVAPGSATISEAGHQGTSLGDYDSEVSCDSGKGSSNSSSTTFTLAYGDQVTCTITNHRKQAPVVVTPPPDANPPADKTPPRLTIRASHLQNVLRTGIVKLSVSCNERCAVRANGKARGLALRGVTRNLQARQRATLELRASKRVRNALKRRGVVVVNLRGSDAAGNVSTASFTVRVKRG